MPLLLVHRPVLISTYLRPQCLRQARYLLAQALLLAGLLPAAWRHLRYAIMHLRLQGFGTGAGAAAVVDEFEF